MLLSEGWALSYQIRSWLWGNLQASIRKMAPSPVKINQSKEVKAEEDKEYTKKDDKK